MINVKRQVTVLLTTIGEDLYRVLRDICDPKTHVFHIYKEFILTMYN